MDAEPLRTADTLHARSLDSVFWLTLQNTLAALLLVAIPTALARLLSANDLGFLEIALAFFGLAALFMELGTGPVIIQRPAIDAGFLSTVFLINVATGVCFAAVLIGGAGGITAWLRMDERLPAVLRSVGFTLVPLSTAIVPRNLLARRLQYRWITVADAVAGAAATVAALAVLSRGIDAALIVGFTVYGLTATAVLWAGARWWPTTAPDPRTVWPLLAFSLSVSGARIIENLTLQSDRFLIGRYLGAASLGLFGLARTLVRVPLRYLLNTSEEVLLPGLSLLQADRPRAREYYLTTVRIELAMLGPVVIFVSVFAGELTRLLFGPDWDRAAFIAQMLALTAWRHITGHTTGAVLLSQGRPDLQLRWTAYALVLSLVYFFVGRPWGLEGVAMAAAVLETAGWAIRHTMANAALELPGRQFVRALAPLWIAHGVFMCLVIGIRLLTLGTSAAPAWRVAGALPVAAVAYLAILRLATPGLLTVIRRGAAEAVARGMARQG